MTQVDGDPQSRRPKSSAIAKQYIEGAAYKALGASYAHSDEYHHASNNRIGDRLAAPMHTALTADDAQVGVGTELALHMAMDPGDTQARNLVDTVREPELVTARASVERLRLLDSMALVEQGLDVAETIQPKNTLERMMAHQLAATHAMAMRMMAQAQEYLIRSHPDDFRVKRPLEPHIASIEANRLAGTAARLMSTFQEGMLALAKSRQGGRQTMKVIHQYVQVNEGGQAVVAGSKVATQRKRKTPK